MKINLLNDIHLEFGPYNHPFPGGDVLILAGDIFPYVCWDKPKYRKNIADFYTRATKAYKHIIQLAGNHEYYGRGDINFLTQDFYSRVMQYHNITFLNNGFITIEGIRFIGSTLWTDFNKENPEEMLRAQMFMNDYQSIIDLQDQFHRLRPEKILQLHNNSLVFIRQALRDHDKCIVATHHSPSYRGVTDEFHHSKGNSFYHSDLEYMFEEPSLLTWVHGHVHQSLNYTINDKLVICNPRGYYNIEENPNFDPSLIIEFGT